ncbi:hypothetical protein SteCoe_13248 [Stentor coeruleus]|uniref:UBX domain-containing protein n=1 Tax=Stentor coeruleus TaxID=5963 RepID=A0A1R2C8U5_9CILI|nr:hypothetical protein SteCoe_13248 [Stentor coeruleus]
MEIPHEEAIQNFCAITGNWDVEVAIAYLSNNNWDVSEASNDFMGLSEPRQVHQQIPQATRSGFGIGSIFSWIGSTISWIFSGFFSSTPVTPFQAYIQNLNIQNTPTISALPLEASAGFAADRNKLLLIYVHHEDTGDSFIRNVLCSQEIIVIINQVYIFCPFLGNTEEGSIAVARFSESRSVIFAIANPVTSEILERIDRVPTKNQLRDFLLNNVAHNNINEDIQRIQDRIIREQQERELKEAEDFEIRRTEEERKKIIAAKEQREVEEKRNREEREMRDRKMQMIGDEPPAGPDITQIIFRLPSGDKIERRFIQDSKIEILYLFLESKGFNNVEIVSGFPTKVMKEGTLFSEGLTPRALIHVRLIQ